MRVSAENEFNPDPKRNNHGQSFLVENLKQYHIPPSPLIFNNNNVMQSTFQKHLAIIHDNQLSFAKHLETVLCKINKTVGLIGKLQNLLLRTVLITFYKVFVRHHLNYGNILFEQAHNASFH